MFDAGATCSFSLANPPGRSQEIEQPGTESGSSDQCLMTIRSIKTQQAPPLKKLICISGITSILFSLPFFTPMVGLTLQIKIQLSYTVINTSLLTGNKYFNCSTLQYILRKKYPNQDVRLKYLFIYKL
jgi:hypothetical protein